ncbi:MAG TPA: DUF4911 domain-containing protein [Thermodesulforhabdus norvegica]|uniref:DUF4911 domain-containing protein n=1 Tax=Thermodesulforhabdus norvegica TaxID=39841 RepID=A0A7C0WUG2_9BACT|nr:DUF4911 domain-containing protein [Thermodesulforhabdus norvegica]
MANPMPLVTKSLTLPQSMTLPQFHFLCNNWVCNGAISLEVEKDPMIPTFSTVRRYLIDPPKIHFLTFIIEAYEGVAVVTTEDRKAGIVRLEISPGQENIIDEIVAREGKELGMKEIVAEKEVDNSC